MYNTLVLPDAKNRVLNDFRPRFEEGDHIIYFHSLQKPWIMTYFWIIPRVVLVAII